MPFWEMVLMAGYFEAVKHQQKVEDANRKGKK